MLIPVVRLECFENLARHFDDAFERVQARPVNVSRARLLFGIPIWRRQLGAPDRVDLDYAVRPTFVDGELCVLRSPAVCAGDAELRRERVYILKRMRNRLWQDGSFTGLSDRPVFGFELDP